MFQPFVAALWWSRYDLGIFAGVEEVLVDTTRGDGFELAREALEKVSGVVNRAAPCGVQHVVSGHIVKKRN